MVLGGFPIQRVKLYLPAVQQKSHQKLAAPAVFQSAVSNFKNKDHTKEKRRKFLPEVSAMRHICLALQAGSTINKV